MTALLEGSRCCLLLMRIGLFGFFRDFLGSRLGRFFYTAFLFLESKFGHENLGCWNLCLE